MTTIFSQIFITTFAVLLQELIFIRWLPAQVRVVAYFPNLVLISAFLGLGLGCLLAPKRSLLIIWPLLVALVVAVAVFLNPYVITGENTTEHLWLLYWGYPSTAPKITDMRWPLILFFVLSAASFVPLGQSLAVRLLESTKSGKPLVGYAFDILGSFVGVVIFSMLSFWQTFPIVWFSLLFAVAVPLMFKTLPHALCLVVSAALSLWMVTIAERSDYYSPYYAINLESIPTEDAQIILANGSLHQRIQNMSQQRLAELKPGSFGALMIEGYHRPYSYLRTKPRKVLIIGAGNGNDVAVALEQGAVEVHAVEIDPQILALGKQHHPNRPYASPRVKAFITDARTYLNESTEQYDLIVFATLDSMTKLSALSSIRLDNFVYTRECLEAAKRRLTPQGGVILNFWIGQQFIHDKLLSISATVFGDQIRAMEKYYAMFNVAYLLGPAFEGAVPNGKDLFHITRRQVAEHVQDDLMPNDDWPYLYLKSRSVTPFYLQLIAALGLISIAAVLSASKAMRRGILKGEGIDHEMFLYGLGFLLLETRAVTQMSLVWGTTWLTSSVVFGSILLMVLGATLLNMRTQMRWEYAFAGLIVSLLIAYAMPLSLLLSQSLAVKLGLSLVIVGLPVLFSGICFSQRFAQRQNSDLAFGWNLLGSVAGGLLEFTSMAIGLKALVLLAILSYLMAYLAQGHSAKVSIKGITASSPIPTNSSASDS